LGVRFKVTWKGLKDPITDYDFVILVLHVFLRGMWLVSEFVEISFTQAPTLKKVWEGEGRYNKEK